MILCVILRPLVMSKTVKLLAVKELKKMFRLTKKLVNFMNSTSISIWILSCKDLRSIIRKKEFNKFFWLHTSVWGLKGLNYFIKFFSLSHEILRHHLNFILLLENLLVNLPLSWEVLIWCLLKPFEHTKQQQMVLAKTCLWINRILPSEFHYLFWL